MPLLPDAAPLHLPGVSPAVLVLHGFSGQPYSVKAWARHLHEQGGLAVSVPRLPGHGTTWQELNRTTYRDWYAEAERALRQLRSEHEEVFVMGLSMGGTLALRLAERNEVSGLVLVNPSVFTKRLDRFALPVLRHLVGGFPGITNDIKRAGGDEHGYNRIPLHAAHSLTQLWHVTKRDIAAVTAPTLIYTSTDDHVVEPPNSRWILDHISSRDKRQEFLHDSYHVATLDNDAAGIFAGSLEFVRSLSRVL